MFVKALSKLKAQSSNVSLHWNVAKETFELWVLSFETAFENDTPRGIGCNVRRYHRKLRCRKWISLVVRKCSYTPVTEPVPQSIHYARSVISRSGAALRRDHWILFNQDMEPKGDFFWKIIRPKSFIGPLERASTLGFAPCRNSADYFRSVHH